MIEKEDYTTYLSVDNGKGLLIREKDAFILAQYGINYFNYSTIHELIFTVGNYIDDHYDEDIDDLDEVLEYLMESYYYYEVNK